MCDIQLFFSSLITNTRYIQKERTKYMKSFSDYTLDIGVKFEAAQSLISMVTTFMESQEVGTDVQRNMVHSSLCGIQQLLEDCENEMYEILAETMNVTPGQSKSKVKSDE